MRNLVGIHSNENHSAHTSEEKFPPPVLTPGAANACALVSLAQLSDRLLQL